MSRKIAIYYPDARGANPALEFLLGLPQDEQQKAFAYVSYLEEQGERLRRPIAEYLGDRMYELRPKHVRILYAAQTAVAPPTFVFFTNVATKFHFSYERFLVNQLREAYGFVGSPIRLHVRRRGSKE